MSPGKSQILNVGIVGINELTHNMLELYFSRQCHGCYVLTGTEQAQVLIADLDAVGGRKLLDEQLAVNPHRPVVAFSVRDTEIDGVQLLRKPIQLDELGRALDFFHSEIDHTPVVDESIFAIHVLPEEDEPAPAEPEAEPVEPAIEHPVAELSELSHSEAVEIEVEPAEDSAADLELPETSYPEAIEIEEEPAEDFAAGSELSETSYPEAIEIEEEPAENFAAELALSEPPLSEVTEIEELSEVDFAPEAADIGTNDVGQPGGAAIAPVIGSRQGPEHGCCGSREDIDLADAKARKALFYYPEDYLQGAFEIATDLASSSGSAVKLKVRGGKTLFFLPQAGTVLSDVSDRLMRALCVQSGESGKDFVITKLKESEESLIADSKGEQCEIDPLLWKVTLWSSRGRVPVGTDLEGVVELDNWPNFTRLMVIPEFMRITALITQGEHSLVTVTESLGIAQRYVFSFYSACCALNLVSVDASAVAEKTGDRSVGDKKRHTMFGKILTHLRGD